MNRSSNRTIRKCFPRAFQWMVMPVVFDNHKIFRTISVSRPWWQKSPSVLEELNCQSFSPRLTRVIKLVYYPSVDQTLTKSLWVDRFGGSEVCGGHLWPISSCAPPQEGITNISSSRDHISKAIRLKSHQNIHKKHTYLMIIDEPC
jgi:hypothetical protein